MRGCWFVGVVGMNIRSGKGLRISCCRIIWFERRGDCGLKIDFVMQERPGEEREGCNEWLLAGEGDGKRGNGLISIR